jgi:transcriptional regulator with PAS, ATPase and Fis domain
MSALLMDEFLRDATAIHRLATQSLFERLDSLCEGAVAVDRQARIVWINDKYLATLGLESVREAIGREIEDVIANSLMREVLRSGQAILLDIMELGGQPLVVTRMPLQDPQGLVIGAIVFVLHDPLNSLKPLVAKFERLQSELAEARRRLADAVLPARCGPSGGAARGVPSYADAIAGFERTLIQSALNAAGGKVPAAAKLLGLSRATVYSKMSQLGLASRSLDILPPLTTH